MCRDTAATNLHAPRDRRDPAVDLSATSTYFLVFLTFAGSSPSSVSTALPRALLFARLSASSSE